jgi:hypothetical protein
MKMIAKIVFVIASLAANAAIAAPYYQTAPTIAALQAVPNPALAGHVAVRSYTSGTSLGGGNFDYTSATITPDNCVNFAASGSGTWVRELAAPGTIDLSMCGLLDPTGSADDEAIIHNAVNYAEAAGGARITVPVGLYKNNGCFDMRDHPNIVFAAPSPHTVTFYATAACANQPNQMFEWGVNASTTPITGGGLDGIQVNVNGLDDYGIVFSGLQFGILNNTHCAQALWSCYAIHAVTSTNQPFGWSSDNTLNHPTCDETFGTDSVGDQWTLPAWTGTIPTTTAKCLSFSDNTPDGVDAVTYGNSDTRNSVIEPAMYTITGNGLTFGYSTTDHVFGGQFNLSTAGVVTCAAAAPEAQACNAAEFEDTANTSHCGSNPSNKSAEHNFVYGLENGKGWYQSDNRYTPPTSYSNACGEPAYDNVVWASSDNGGIDNFNTMPGSTMELCIDQGYCSGIGQGALIAAAGASMQAGTPAGNAYAQLQQYAAGYAPAMTCIGTLTLPCLSLTDTNLNASNMSSDPNTGNVVVTTGINSGVGLTLNIVGTSCYVEAGGPCNTNSGEARTIGRLEVQLAAGDAQTFNLYKRQSVTLVGINNTANACDGNISGHIIVLDSSHFYMQGSFFASDCGQFTATESTSSATLTTVVLTSPTTYAIVALAQAGNAVVSDLTQSSCIQAGTTIVGNSSGASTITLSVRLRIATWPDTQSGSATIPMRQAACSSAATRSPCRSRGRPAEQAPRSHIRWRIPMRSPPARR